MLTELGGAWAGLVFSKAAWNYVDFLWRDEIIVCLDLESSR